jgi:hypothetical protein
MRRLLRVVSVWRILPAEWRDEAVEYLKRALSEQGISKVSKSPSKRSISKVSKSPSKRSIPKGFPDYAKTL